MGKFLKMGPSPHIRTNERVEDIMFDVVIALLPALLVATYVFGFRAITMVAVSVATCIMTEFIFQKLMKQDITVFDGSSIITGILFAFIVPAYMPIYYLIPGAFISIALGKVVFGGLGHNIFNPALVGRAFVQASWPVAITTFTLDGMGGATILDSLKRGLPLGSALVSNGNTYVEIFLGRMGGSLGETSAFALMLGGIYLIYKKQIAWQVPATMIGTVAILSIVAGQNPILQILSGGLFLGAFFMATDMTTSPDTLKGKVVFALGIGILISLIRFKGGYPEGTAYAILMMNGAVPLINRYTKPKKFGQVKA